MFLNNPEMMAQEQHKDRLRRIEREQFIKTVLPQQNKVYPKQILVLTMLLLIVGLVGCRPASAETHTVLAAPQSETKTHSQSVNDYPEMIITAADHIFAAPAEIEAGLTTVRLKNEGQKPHHVQLARLNDGVDIAQFQEALQAGPAAFGLVTWAGGVAAVDPADSQSVTVDLEPGTYLLLCFMPDHDGTPHIALGQMSSLEVVEPVGGYVKSTPSQSDGTVKMLDFSYVLPGEIKAGQQVWEIINQGEQPHEIALIKLAEGKTMDDVQAFMPNPHGAAPLAMPVVYKA